MYSKIYTNAHSSLIYETALEQRRSSSLVND